MGAQDDTVTRGHASLRVDGHVGRAGALPLERLIGLTTPLDDGRLVLPVIDVLAQTRLSAIADVLMVRGPNGASVALPVRAVVDDRGIRFVFDRSVEPRLVLLDAPGWTESSTSMPVERMTALTFAEFVMRR